MGGKRQTAEQLADSCTCCSAGTNHGTQRNRAKTTGSYYRYANQHSACPNRQAG
ncbi:hypothetical protein D3C84_1106150 [compost metagenome]